MGSGGNNPAQQQASAHAEGSSQPAYSHLLRMCSASLTELTSSNRHRQAAWEPARAAALSKCMAHAARIVPRRPTCPGGVQLRRVQASSSSSSSSSSTGSLVPAGVLCSSQSCPMPPNTVPSFVAPASQQLNQLNRATANPCAGVAVDSVCQPRHMCTLLRAPSTPTAHPTPGSFGALLTARPLVPCCTEITPCGDDSSSNSSSSQQEGDTTPPPDPAAAAAVPYPECLFDQAAAVRMSSSFTTQVYSSSTGQQVAVARCGSIILAVFVKETTGEVWEADEDQITFPGGNKGSEAHAAGAGMVYASVAADTVPQSAGAAARAYSTLNRSSSSSGGSASGWSLRHTLGSCVSSKSTSSSTTSRRSRSSLSRALGSFISSVSSKSEVSTGCISRTDSSRGLLGGRSTGSMSSRSYPNRGSSRRSTCAGEARPFSMLAAVKARITEWRQARKAQHQAQAAAYWQELDQAAHLAVRLAGCQSFVLPRNWPQAARQQVREKRRLRVREKRRLRVLLATYSRV